MPIFLQWPSLPLSAIIGKLQSIKQFCGSLENLPGAPATAQENNMKLKQMDNVIVVVDDLEAMKAFFFELGMGLEGETMLNPWPRRHHHWTCRAAQLKRAW
jgi:hypothetical protein